MVEQHIDGISMTKILQTSVISKNKNRKKPPQIDNDADVQACLPQCLQLYIHNKQLLDLSSDSKSVNPDIHELFMRYNHLYFDNKLDFCLVCWSDSYEEPCNMYENSGYCYHSGKVCQIYLSTPILQYRPNKELMETLLHEMIHAYLFLHNVHHHDRSDHGKRFVAIMNAINYCTKSLKIDIHHYCKQEMDQIKMCIFQCNGRCQRVMQRPNNRPPGKHEKWWKQHQSDCGGLFVRIQENMDKKTRKERQRKTVTKTSVSVLLRKRKRTSMEIEKNLRHKPAEDEDTDDDIIVLSNEPAHKKRKSTETETGWHCKRCTYKNPTKRMQCEICTHHRN